MPRKTPFTLVELVVVIAIIVIGIGVASVGLRKSSGPAAFEQALRDFQAFNARARMQAMELGRDRVIVYHPLERVFSAVDPAAEEETQSNEEIERTLLEVPAHLKIVSNYDPPAYETPANLAKLSWKLPENYQLSAGDGDVDNGYGDALEVFRYFSDGSASGKRKFTMQFNDMRRTMTISPLTGMLHASEEEPQ